MELSKKGGESIGPLPQVEGVILCSLRRAFGLGYLGASGNAQLEILRSLQLGFRGIYSWDSRRAVLAFFGARFSLLQ